MWAELPPEIVDRLRPTAADADDRARSTYRAGWIARLTELAKYRTYGDDWDGQGAPGIRGEVIDRAEALLKQLWNRGLIPPVGVYPGVQGDVEWDWQWADRSSLAINVIDPEVADLFLHEPESKIRYWTLNRFRAELIEDLGTADEPVFVSNK